MNTPEVINYRNAPSAKSLQKHFKIDAHIADCIRRTIRTSKRVENALRKIDEKQWLGLSFGVEEMIMDRFAVDCDWEENIPFVYINTGDTYAPTLIAKNGRVYVSCWGDEYERLPERIKKLDPTYER